MVIYRLGASGEEVSQIQLRLQVLGHSRGPIDGGIGSKVRALILANFTGLAANLPGERMELERMKIIANRRAEAAKPRWVEDVRARKLCIASGAGEVHGIPYDLEAQFGIALR